MALIDVARTSRERFIIDSLVKRNHMNLIKKIKGVFQIPFHSKWESLILSLYPIWNQRLHLLADNLFFADRTRNFSAALFN